MLKNGKIFGRINIIDFLAVIALIAALVGIGIRVITFNDNNVAGTVPVEFVVRVENVREYTIQGLEKGGSIYSEKEDKLVGEIIKVEYENAKVENVMLDGERKLVERPNRYTAYVTVRSDSVYQGGRYSDAAENHIGVGSEYPICSKYVFTNGKIVTLNPIQ